MSPGGRSFRAAEAEVTVEDDAIRIRKSPRIFLQGQRLRWRHGTRLDRLRMLLVVALFVAAVVLQLAIIGDGGLVLEAPALLTAVLAAVHVVPHLWSLYSDTEVLRSDVEDITLDADERELTIAWDPSDDPLYVMSGDEAALTLPTDDDVREARTAFRTNGVTEAFELSKPKTETDHRYDSVNGVVFCEHCGANVSPSHQTCPACESALRVERPVAARDRDRTSRS